MLSNQDIGLPVVRANNINEGQLNMQNDVKYWYVNDPQGAKTENYLVHRYDILINFINSETKMGTAAIVQNEPTRPTIYTTNILKAQTGENYVPNFWFALTQTYRYKIDIKKITKPAVNQASFTTVDFKKMTYAFPKFNEQVKIGDYFCFLDHLITLHQRQLDSLKKSKKSFLQKLFPKNGAVKPEIRFAGFTDDWEQHKLGEELDLLKDGTHGTHKNVDQGPYLLSAKNIKNGQIVVDKLTDRKISEYDFKSIHKNFSLQKGDVLLTIVGSIGESAVINNPIGITFQRSVAYLRPGENLLSRFLNTNINNSNFQKELKKRQVVSAQPGIYLGDLSIIPIAFPIIKEQQKISAFFQSLDHLITLRQRKLDTLKKMKKALLQQMFI
ncbi:MAG TPA: restriction endonuclease subunit S [Candidatus Ligilactobacillus excrementipullorum]|nr:restriction endonuclease subunit S [Candidatus Ligilactobacillus excrementipullorum]